MLYFNANSSPVIDDKVTDKKLLVLLYKRENNRLIKIPLDFIDKETSDQVFKNRVADCVLYTKTTLLENQSVVDYFDYSYKGNDLCIPYHDILYIETTGTSHKLRIVGKNFAKEFYGTMTDIQEKDKETQRFYLAHKSFLVNIGNVREIDRKKMEVVFYEDHRCPISRLKTKKLRELMAKNQKK